MNLWDKFLVGMAPENLNKFIGQGLKLFAEQAGKVVAKIPVTFKITPEAMALLTDFKKKMDEGATPLEKYTNELKKIGELYNGPVKDRAGNAMDAAKLAAAGLFGKAARFNEGVIGADMAGKLGFEAFMKLRSAVGDHAVELPTAAFARTAEAQEIINRNSQETMSVQQEILRVLEAAAQEAAEQKRFQEQAVDELRKMNQNPAIKVRRN